MVVDGNDDDWGWIDPAFAINPDTMFEILGSEWPPAKDDWDCILYVAWSSAPDNSLYYFSRVTDDSLGLFVENPQGVLEGTTRWKSSLMPTTRVRTSTRPR